MFRNEKSQYKCRLNCHRFILAQMQNRNRSRSSSSQESGRGSNNFAEPSKRLFISGISSSVQEGELRAMLEKVVSLNDLYYKIPEDREKNGFAIAETNSISEAEDLIRQINGKKLRDRMIYVKFAKPRENKGGKRDEGNDRGGRGGNFNQESKGRFKLPNVNWNNQDNNGEFQTREKGNFGKQGNFDGNRGGFNEGGRNNGGGDRKNGGERGNGERNGGFQRREERGFEGKGGMSKPEPKAQGNDDYDY